MKKALFFGIAACVIGAMTASLDACGVDDLNLENRACPCGPGYVCDTPRNVCVKPEVLLDGAIIVGEAAVTPPPATPPCKGPDCTCATETDCVDPAYPKCAGGKCVQCVTAPDNCPVGSYCLGDTDTCAPGCKADAECLAISPTVPHCNLTRHQCVECASDNDCTGGKKCTPAGACATGCFDGGAPCPNGGSCCGGLCVDTTKDPLNCNGCGNACSGGATQCCGGTCSNPLTDKNNCGSCNFACNSTVNNTGSSCSSGRCQFTCTSGYGHCTTGNTGCATNLTSTATACGSCNIDCIDQLGDTSTGIACTSSKCTFTGCKTGYVSNGTQCVPCGAITQLCCTGNTCPVSGLCEPAPANDGKCH